MSTATQFSTKDRILAAAEELFARQGFAGTSLREVTRRANVNIAAVNYHFGSKDNLVNEVFRRRMDDMSARRLDALHAAVAADPRDLEAILGAFIEPPLALAIDRSGSAFVRIIARAYAEKNDGLRRFLSDNYGHVLREFANAIAAALPGLDRDDLYWRLDFTAGALTYAMADFGITQRADGRTEAAHCRHAADALIQFAAAGLRAPRPSSASRQGTHDHV
ncbi:TetR family transcriptional regulator [Coralloluteibacterium stylophorae]|uniref:TetR family transcriptional regulator n=1 Tax=Coralloluteibacterium stylophorae TaxID=1776034 RepID=A0AAP2FYV8_9GAMM|nr:TetR family transcriptional regulator [Coralloluteibacterium stylophorae]